MIRLMVLILIVGALYWFWRGPYQDLTTESYAESLQKNAKTMRRCLSAKDYYAGATGGSSGTLADNETSCAEKHRLYRHQGQWHPLGDKRPQR